MRVDLRVKHDVEARKAAIGLFELGHGYKSAAIALSLPAEAVRRWQEIYRAFGSEVLLRMDGKQGRYTYEQKVAAASAVVDGGMTKTEAMAAFVSVNVTFTIFTNVFSPIMPTRMRRIRQRGCAAFGA